MLCNNKMNDVTFDDDDEYVPLNLLRKKTTIEGPKSIPVSKKVCVKENIDRHISKMTMTDKTRNTIKARSYSIDVFKTTTFNESSIDMLMFEKIIDNIDEVQTYIGLNFDFKKNERLDWDGTKTILIDTFKHRKKNTNILYVPTNNSKQGRHFSKRPSLQGMARPIRHALCKSNHVDIDCKNCHPVILRTLCDAYNFNCDKINYYIDNRNQCLQELIDLTSKDKDTVKQWLLSLLNGGNSKELFTFQVPEWVLDFKAQIKLIHEQFYNLPEFSSFVKQIQKQYGTDVFNPLGKVMNKILCMYENAIIQHVIHFFNENGIQVISNQFDGVLVKNDPQLDSLFDPLTTFIHDNLGIPIEFVVKNMDEGDDLIKALEPLKTKAETKTAEKNAKTEEKVRIKAEKERSKLLEQLLKEEKKKKLPELSDEHVATYFLDKIKDDFLYHKRLNKYYIYNNDERLWVDSPFTTVSTLFSQFILTYLDELIDLSDNSVNIDKYEEYKTKVCSTKTQRDLLFQVQTHLKDNSDFIDDNLDQLPHLFPFGLDVFDFTAGTPRPRVKEDYFTITTRNKYNPKYDSIWITNYLKEILVTDDQVYIDSFSSLLSHNLTNNNTIKKIPVLLGNSDSGKSACLALSRNTFGDFEVNAPQRLFVKSKSESVLQTEIFPLINKRCATISELEESQEFNESLLKHISGNDIWQNIRNGGENGYMKVKIIPKLFIISNEMPQTKDPALQKRFVYIHFKNKFEKSESKYNEILSKSDDFFSYLCHYATELTQNNFKFHPCVQMNDFKKEVLDSRPSSAKEFLSSCLIFEDEKGRPFEDTPQNRMKKPDLYIKYHVWCSMGNGDKEIKKNFYKEAALEPFNLHRENKERYVKSEGIELFRCLQMRKGWNKATDDDPPPEKDL